MVTLLDQYMYIYLAAGIAILGTLVLILSIWNVHIPEQWRERGVFIAIALALGLATSGVLLVHMKMKGV